jgi:hypothetical protein
MTRHRITRRSADQLIGAAVVAAHAGDAPADRVDASDHSMFHAVRAAAAPAAEAELGGEAAALAAFRAARFVPAPRPVTVRRRILVTAGRLLTLKAAIVAATAVGGVALAASAGVLPNPLVDPAPVVSTDAPAGPGRSGGHSGVPTGSPRHSPGTGGADSGGDASPAAGVSTAATPTGGATEGPTGGATEGSGGKPATPCNAGTDNPGRKPTTHPAPGTGNRKTTPGNGNGNPTPGNGNGNAGNGKGNTTPANGNRNATQGNENAGHGK